MNSLANNSGATACHHAAKRGDIEIVELLLSFGANPFIKNDLGHDATMMCKSFPAIYGLLKKRKRKRKMRHFLKTRTSQHTKISLRTRISGNVETLAKRISDRDSNSARHVADFVGDTVDAVRIGGQLESWKFTKICERSSW